MNTSSKFLISNVRSTCSFLHTIICRPLLPRAGSPRYINVCRAGSPRYVYVPRAGNPGRKMYLGLAALWDLLVPRADSPG